MASVRKTCEEVLLKASHVAVNESALHRVCEDLKNTEFLPESWSSFPYHYLGKNQIDYIFALDALNYCFWPTEGLEYEHLAANLKEIMQSDPFALSPQALASFTSETLESKVFCGFRVPLAEERTRLLRELGTNTLKHFQGNFSNILQASDSSAQKVTTT